MMKPSAPRPAIAMDDGSGITDVDAKENSICLTSLKPPLVMVIDWIVAVDPGASWIPMRWKSLLLPNPVKVKVSVVPPRAVTDRSTVPPAAPRSWPRKEKSPKRELFTGVKVKDVRV